MISTASRAGQSARNTLPAVTSRRVPIGSYRPPSVVPRLPPAVGNGGVTMSATMQSIRQQAFGGPQVLRLADEERPVALPTEMLGPGRGVGVKPGEAGSRCAQIEEMDPGGRRRSSASGFYGVEGRGAHGPGGGGPGGVDPWSGRRRRALGGQDRQGSRRSRNRHGERGQA